MYYTGDYSLWFMFVYTANYSTGVGHDWSMRLLRWPWRMFFFCIFEFVLSSDTAAYYGYSVWHTCTLTNGHTLTIFCLIRCARKRRDLFKPFQWWDATVQQNPRSSDSICCTPWHNHPFQSWFYSPHAFSIDIVFNVDLFAYMLVSSLYSVHLRDCSQHLFYVG